MQWKAIFLFCLLLNWGFSQNPSESLQRLIDGNQRYVDDQLLRPDRSADRREEMLEGQHPFAAIMGCSDSRVPPEIIFDQGLGDLFIVRVAGNVVGPVELDSIEYSVKYLGSSIVLVLGHELCGAVTAVMEGQTADIEAVADLIQPAIKRSKSLEAAIKDNVRWVVRYLKTSPVLKKYMAEQKVDCVGAYYNVGTGKIEILK